MRSSVLPAVRPSVANGAQPGRLRLSFLAPLLRRRLTLGAAAAFCTAFGAALCAACAAPSASAPPPGSATPPVEVAVTAPRPPDPAKPAAQPAVEETPAATADAPVVELPLPWVKVQDDLAFAVALRRAGESRQRMLTDSKSTLPADSTDAMRWFGRVQTHADYTSRWYAAAYHAKDATPPKQIEVLALASDVALGWAKRLDEVGLAKLPVAWRSDSHIAATFEDVAQGPARRWLDEGVALVQLCVDFAKHARVDSDSSRSCTALQKTYGRFTVRKRSADGKSATPSSPPSGCGCTPGDPLCSTTDWCKPSN